MQRLNEDLMLLTGCATVQMFGRQPFAMENWVQPKASQCGISIRPSGSGAGFSLSTHVSPISITPLLLHTHSNNTVTYDVGRVAQLV